MNFGEILSFDLSYQNKIIGAFPSMPPPLYFKIQNPQKGPGF